VVHILLGSSVTMGPSPYDSLRSAILAKREEILRAWG
jgi:hypothetical protein